MHIHPSQGTTSTYRNSRVSEGDPMNRQQFVCSLHVIIHPSLLPQELDAILALLLVRNCLLVLRFSSSHSLFSLVSLCIHTPFPYLSTTTIHLYPIFQPPATHYHIPELNSQPHDCTPITFTPRLGNAYVPATFPFSQSPGNKDPIACFVGFLL